MEAGSAWKRRWRWTMVLVSVVCVCAVSACTTPPPSGPTTTSTTTPAPTWTISVQVGAPQSLVAKYGGMTALRSKVVDMLATTSARFDRFSHVIVFRLTDLYSFADDPPGTGDASQDQAWNHSHPGYDLQIILDEVDAVQGGWIPVNSTILHAWGASEGGVFDSYAIDGITHEEDHSLGAVDEWGQDVKAGVDSSGVPYNPINGASYEPAPSIANVPYGVSTWDPWTISLINRSNGKVSLNDNLIDQSLPATYKVTAVSSTGVAVPHAVVTLYPVAWYSGRVSITPAMTGTAATDGTWVLPSNPFQPFTPGYFYSVPSPTFLVKVSAGRRVGYAWLTMEDAGNAYFSGQTGEMAITVPLSSG